MGNMCNTGTHCSCLQNGDLSVFMCLKSLLLIREKEDGGEGTLLMCPGIAVQHMEMKLSLWHLWSIASHLGKCQQRYAALRNTRGSLLKVPRHIGPQQRRGG